MSPTTGIKPISFRYARAAVGIAALVLIAVGSVAGATGARADGGGPRYGRGHHQRWHHGGQPGWHQAWHRGWHHGWHRGWNRPPPVVYAPRYRGYGYAPPPVVYGPSVGINLPGFHIRFR